MSDYDPSFVLLMTYCEVRKCSYLKVLKIYNKVEQEEDWSSARNNNDQDERSYSQVEDDAKNNLIQNLRMNLVNEPSINKKQHAAFQNDNIQVKLNSE